MESDLDGVRVTNGIWTPDEDTLPHLSDREMGRPPIKLMLSLVGMCNLRCFHCLGTSDEIVKASQDPASASAELIDFLADQVLPHVRAIRLGGVGYTEQLIGRRFDYFMERVQPHVARLGSFELITNLSRMTEARADLLARSLTDVHVSLEGVEENFTRLRGLPWPRLVRHFEMLREAKRRNPHSRMKITLLVCAMRDMLDDLLRFDVFTELGVERIIVRELVPLAPHHDQHVLYREPDKTRAFIREFRARAEEAGIEPVVLIADRYDPPAVAASERQPPALPVCTLPFEVLTVIHTGQFGVCCYITDLAAAPSSLSTLNVMDVWNSPSFVSLRTSVNTSKPPAPCLSCEVKVGHMSEEEKAELRARVGPETVELAKTRTVGTEILALRRQLADIEADRAARLDVIHAQGRQLGETEAERNTLRAELVALRAWLDSVEADRAARLDVIQAQGRRLGEVEAERNTLSAELVALRARLDEIEADRAARLDVIQAQGRQLGEIEGERNDLRCEVGALREHLENAETDRAARLEVIQAQTERVQALTDEVSRLRRSFEMLRRTRLYRLLRALGRWKWPEVHR